MSSLQEKERAEFSCCLCTYAKERPCEKTTSKRLSTGEESQGEMCLQTDQKDALKMEERGLKWRECGQHMEAQKGKGKDSLVETAGGNTGPLTPDF